MESFLYQETRVSQSAMRSHYPQCEPVSTKGTGYLAAVRLQLLPTVKPEQSKLRALKIREISPRQLRYVSKE